MAIAMRINLERTGARTYARQVAKDTLTGLLRSQMTYGRCPHDAWGRPMPMMAAVVLEDEHPAHVDVERTVANREIVARLRDRLDPRDWKQLVAVFMEGAKAARAEDRLHFATVQHRVEAILRRIGYRARREMEGRMGTPISIPEPPANDTPECHPSGTSPVGYDPADKTCINCRDKFTCLPRAIDGKLVALTLKADLEVDAVVHGRLGFMDAIGRMKRRLGAEKAKEPIPAELSPTWPGLEASPGDEEEAEEIEVDEEEVEETEPDDDEDTDEGEEDDEPEGDEESEEAVAEAAPEPAAPTGEEDTDVAKKNEKPKKTAKPKPAKAEKPKKTPPPKAEKPAKAPKAEKPKAAAPAPELPARAAPAAPAKAAAPAKPVDEKPVEKDGVVKVGKVRIGTVKKSRNGWGWYAVDGKTESPSWLASKAAAIAGLVKWARAKGPLAMPIGADAELVSAKKPSSAPAPKPSTAKPAKAAAPKAEPTEPPVDRPKSWPTMANGKPLPAPKRLTEEEMNEQLAEAQSKLGANIQLEYGMEIARRKREGDIVAVITAHGFQYDVGEKLAKAAGFDKPVQLFGSLSSVAMWAERRMVSGNDFFNLAKHNCTEVRDTQGRIIDRKGGVAIRRVS